MAATQRGGGAEDSAAGHAQRFRALVGRDPEGSWAAPGRVNLIGEHTDYNDGFVLPVALQHRVVATAARREDDLLVLRSIQQPGSAVTLAIGDLAPGRVTGWAAYAAGVVWALRTDGRPVGGADVVVDGDVPLGAGLSSSAALECSVAAALDGLFSLDLQPSALAASAHRAENEFVGMPSGVMDQYASVLCAEGQALLLDTRTLAVEHVRFDPERAGLALVVVDTRTRHALVDGAYAERRSSCERAARTIGVPALRDATEDDVARLDDPVLRRRARHMVSENARVLEVVQLLRDGDLLAVGPRLTASHASLRDDFEVTVPELDVAVEVALRAGAHGARMTGAGFGGCVIALVDADRVPALVDAVRQEFAGHGFGEPAAFVARPSAGARRIG